MISEPVHAPAEPAPPPAVPSPLAGEGEGEGSHRTQPPPRRKPRMLPPSTALTASRRLIDLAAPQPTDIDFNEIAETLAVLPRFAGHCRRGFTPWTVAEHSIAGADVLASQSDKRLALLFLLHDAHEAYIGDITSPTVAALVALAPSIGTESSLSEPALLGRRLREAVATLKAGLDAAIFAAAGVEPPTAEERRQVAFMDVRLCRAEMAQIMSAPWGLTPPGQRELRPLKLRGALRPAGKPAAAATAFIQRLDAWAPQARRKDAA